MSNNRDDDIDDIFKDFEKAFIEIERKRKPEDLRDETRADTPDLGTSDTINPEEQLEEDLRDETRADTPDLGTSRTLDPNNINFSTTFNPEEQLEEDLLDPKNPLEREWMEGYNPEADPVYIKEPIKAKIVRALNELYQNIDKRLIKKVIYGTVLVGFVGGLYYLNAREIDKERDKTKVSDDNKFLEATNSDMRQIFTLASEYECPRREIEGAWNLELRVKNQGVKELTITRDRPICVILAGDIRDYFNVVWKDGRTGLENGTYKAAITFKRP